MSTLEKISVIIVTYNSNKTIFHLLRSLKFIEKYINEIIIIDNNSLIFNNKKIQKTCKKIKIIRNKSNVGFAKAINQGIKLSKSNFLLLLNPDTYLEDNTIWQTAKIIELDPKIGAIGGKILNKNNQTQYSATNETNFLTALFEFTILKRFFPKNKYSQNFWVENNKVNKPIKVTSLCGAYIIIRKKIKNKLNLFDENFFLYFEDIDFGYSINSKGYKVIFDPNSHIKHIGGASSHNQYHTDLNNWYKSRAFFFKKHENKFNAIILSTIFSIEKYILKTISFLKNEIYSSQSLPPHSHSQRIKKPAR